MNGLEYRVDERDGQTQKYTFITDLTVKEKNCKQLIEVGRSRWCIENQWLNRQKNLQYHFEHGNSQNYVAMKNHYLLAQITDIVMHLFEYGLPNLKTIKKIVIELSSNLLEAIRTRKLTVKERLALAKPI
ncbi:hypothetical protein [Sporosarcina sp. YIM B06819]|uniref:hypothetical protein n=1 Tax=Sporosarcina sp. YIM B06819 TaxID=3081769 RepID=UPI00298C25F7|nr:hypothetical protein [Sporosarcina sp. YIM B06819]